MLMVGGVAGIRLLGFKDMTELAFEDQVKHALFLYPDEMVRPAFGASPHSPPPSFSPR